MQHKHIEAARSGRSLPWQHINFVGKLISLFVVTANARGYNVRPFRSPTSGFWYYVITRKAFGVMSFAAILAGIIIA